MIASPIRIIVMQDIRVSYRGGGGESSLAEISPLLNKIFEKTFFGLLLEKAIQHLLSCTLYGEFT